MTDRIIEAKISLKTIVNILSCFGFHIEETTQGEKRSCMLLGKVYLKVDCFVMLKGKRLTYSSVYVRLVDKESTIRDRLNMVTGNLLEFGEFSEYKITVE